MLEGLTSNMPDAEGGVFMDVKYTKIQTAGCNAPLKITPGHFATNHAHINYYLDMTTLKTRLSEAREIAKSLVGCSSMIRWWILSCAWREPRSLGRFWRMS